MFDKSAIVAGPEDPVRLEAFHTWMAALAEERADDLYRIKVYALYLSIYLSISISVYLYLYLYKTLIV